jgi:hypothetical protein
MSAFDHESPDQSPLMNATVRELKKKRLEMPETYDVTITVRGRGGSSKWKLLKIPREKIFAEGYSEVIRKMVESRGAHVARDRLSALLLPAMDRSARVPRLRRVARFRGPHRERARHRGVASRRGRARGGSAMTEEERLNRNPAPEVVKMTWAELEAMPEVLAPALELHRVYIMQGERTISTFNYMGKVMAMNPLTFDVQPGYRFHGPRVNVDACLTAWPDGTLHDMAGNKITVRLFTGADA